MKRFCRPRLPLFRPLHRCTTAHAVPDAVTVYTVQDGDTLWEIATDHSISVRELQRLNEDLFPRRPRCGVSPRKDFHADNTIYPGDKLYLPRHAQLCQEDHAPELDEGTVTRTVFIHDDLGRATTVVPASTAMTNNSEHTQALNSCGPNVTGIGLAMIACVGLTTFGSSFLRGHWPIGKPKGIVEVSTSDRTAEDITAHSADDLSGKYIKSGFTVPSELHNTTVRTAGSEQVAALSLVPNAESPAIVRHSYGQTQQQVSHAPEDQGSVSLVPERPRTGVSGPIMDTTAQTATNCIGDDTGDGRLSPPAPAHRDPEGCGDLVKVGDGQCWLSSEDGVGLNESTDEAPLHEHSSNDECGDYSYPGTPDDMFEADLVNGTPQLVPHMDEADFDCAHDDADPANVQELDQGCVASSHIHDTSKGGLELQQPGVLPDIVEGHGCEDPKPSSTNTHAVSTFTQDHEVTGSAQDEQVSVAQDTPSQDKPELTPAEMVALHAEHRGADVSSSAFEGHVPAADGASVSSEPDNKKGSDATEVYDEVRTAPCATVPADGSTWEVGLETASHASHNGSKSGDEELNDPMGAASCQNLHSTSHEQFEEAMPAVAGNSAPGAGLPERTEVNPVDLLGEILSALYAAATKDEESRQGTHGKLQDDTKSTSASKQGIGRGNMQQEQQDPVAALTQMATIVAAAAGILTGGVAQSLLDMMAPQTAAAKQPMQQHSDNLQQLPTGQEQLEKYLRELSYATERGYKLTGTDRVELERIVMQLEEFAQSEPAQVMEHIDGQWKLAMTDDGDILAIIETVQALPLVTVGDITQSVDVQKETVKNTVQLAAPMPFELSANVQWLMQRPRNVYQTLANRDKSTHVSTPHLLEGLHTAALALGDDVAALASFSTLVQQLQDAITSYGSTAGSGSDQGWLNSFASTTTRIARGPNNSIVVFAREIKD